MGIESLLSDIQSCVERLEAALLLENMDLYAAQAMSAGNKARVIITQPSFPTITIVVRSIDEGYIRHECVAIREGHVSGLYFCANREELEQWLNDQLGWIIPDSQIWYPV